MSEFAGRMGERVTLSRPVPDRDALGGWTGGWATSRQAWAVIEPFGERQAEPLLWRVTMRPTPLFVGDRVLWGTETLQVRTVRIDPGTPDRMIVIGERI